ncbi:MAG: HD domain-containing protein, partial [Pseudomonadota bacterium]|nr:HD domain-containing protein [Pseudomonadota bacterium]
MTQVRQLYYFVADATDLGQGVVNDDESLEDYMDVVRDLSGPIEALFAALKARDSYTAYHSNRTTALASSLGKRCGLSAQQLRVLEAAAAVHDIGKIGVPDAVLLKPGRLDAREWALMKRHSEIGAQLLASIKSTEDIDEVATVVRHHHEGFDGKGYPDALAGEN